MLLAANTGRYRRMIRARQKGFTLIELLVVVAIIAILAAILFPTFLTVRKRAQYQNCNHNVSQWLKAMQMYLGDYNDVFPICGANLCFHHPGKPPFYEAVKNYVAGGEGAKFCQAMIIAYCGGSIEKCKKSYGWSYWFQCRWSWGGFDGINPKANLCGIRFAEIRWPSRSPAIGDTNRCHEHGQNAQGKKEYIYPIGYCDGHVRDVVMVPWDEDRYWYVGIDGSLPPKYRR